MLRGPLERDRDRVLHARSFRRLSGKAFLFPADNAWQARTALAVTLEVASAARVIARHLGLDEDLVEVVALAHDLGRPPFGAAGERALDAVLRARGVEGGFSTRVQTLRVVDLLEVRYEHPGLNLTDRAREALCKLDGAPAAPPPGIDPAGLGAGSPPPRESLAVAAARRAVATLSALEDALAAGFVPLAAVLRLPEPAALAERLKSSGGWPRGVFRQRAALHRALAHAVHSDILLASRRRAGAIGPGPRVAPLLARLDELVATRVGSSQAGRRFEAQAERTVATLFERYEDDPRLLDDSVLLRYKELTGRAYLRDLPRAAQEREIASHFRGRAEFARLLADHIAGMTDRHAAQLLETVTAGSC